MVSRPFDPVPTVQSGEAGISRAYRSYALFMMTAVATLNFVDRQLLSILLEPIKQEFHLSDTQLGFLTGFAFAIFYTLVGFPLAKAADQGNRRTLTAAVIALWSVMTALCGAATGFATLLLARIGVGIGEAGSGPAIQSMLADIYPPRERSSAIAIQSTGVYLGILLGFVAGGWINQFFGWRAAFLVVGLPGVILALFFRFTVREPRRGMFDAQADTGSAPPILDSIRHLCRMPSYRNIPIAMAFYAFAAYGSMTWAPSFFIRTYGMTSGAVGTWLALSAGLAGGVGCYLGGIASDRLVNRTGDARWHMRIPAICTLLTVPMLFGVYLSPAPLPSLLLSAAVWFLGNTWLGPVQATIAGLAGTRRRGMALAFLLFVNNLVGLGLGPQAVGILSDALHPSYGVDALRYALLGTLVIASLLSALFFFRAGRTLREDLEAAQA
jgi:predicted MFS family arabinose efflux permease